MFMFFLCILCSPSKTHVPFSEDTLMNYLINNSYIYSHFFEANIKISQKCLSSIFSPQMSYQMLSFTKILSCS